MGKESEKLGVYKNLSKTIRIQKEDYFVHPVKLLSLYTDLYQNCTM
jgi:hypothetical protein